MAGGGADAAQLLQTCLEATRAVAARRPLTTSIVTGPFLPAHERDELRARAAAHDVVVHTSIDDPLGHIHAADVVVGMAGYNTVTEMMRLARRAIVVPRAGPSAEQGMRARLLAQRGLVDMVDPGQLTPATLAAAIEHALDAPPRRAPLPDLDGVANASAALLAELDAVPATRPRPQPEPQPEPQRQQVQEASPPV
jgi:predicted glycosyltransferase